MAGFQLWVNLAAADKMTAPQYRDVPPSGVPVATRSDGVEVRVIAGSSHGVAGAVTRPTTEPIVLDLTLPPGTRFDAEVPAGHNAFVYVYGGALAVGGDEVGVPASAVEVERMAILANDAQADGVRLSAPAGAGEPTRVLLVAGRPLHEPIAQYGPFVMNTQAQIHQALTDFRDGALAT